MFALRCKTQTGWLHWGKKTNKNKTEEQTKNIILVVGSFDGKM